MAHSARTNNLQNLSATGNRAALDDEAGLSLGLHGR